MKMQGFAKHLIVLFFSATCLINSMIYAIFHLSYEPRYEKTSFLHMRKQRRRSAISAFVFATRIVQSLFLLNPKFQASSHLV